MRASANVARLGLLVGFAAGILSYFGLATAWGETEFSRGTAFIIAGATLIAYDMIYRWLNNRSMGVSRFWSSDAGASLFGLPAWASGCATIIGGIAIVGEGR